MSDAASTDPEALGGEREQYPDPDSYPSSHPEQRAETTEGDASITDGSTPDADLQVEGEETP